MINQRENMLKYLIDCINKDEIDLDDTFTLAIYCGNLIFMYGNNKKSDTIIFKGKLIDCLCYLNRESNLKNYYLN